MVQSNLNMSPFYYPFQVISKDATLAEQSQETEFIVTEYFDSLGKTVMTLMQFVTLDSLATIYFPLIVARPVLLCYFLPILVFVSIGLMNLVTAASWLSCFAICVQNLDATHQQQNYRNSSHIICAFKFRRDF